MVTLFVCLSICLSLCLSVADLEDGGLLALQRDTNLKEYDDFGRINLPFFFISALFSRKSEKTVLFECTLNHTHSFTNGKVLSQNTCIV